MKAEEKLNYPADERTRFSVRIELHHEIGEDPEVGWVRNCRTLEEAQAKTILARDASGYGGSQFGGGDVLDEMGQHVAQISYNGRLWGPEPWFPGKEAIAEAPTPERIQEIIDNDPDPSDTTPEM